MTQYNLFQLIGPEQLSIFSLTSCLVESIVIAHNPFAELVMPLNRLLSVSLIVQKSFAPHLKCWFETLFFRCLASDVTALFFALPLGVEFSIQWLFHCSEFSSDAIPAARLMTGWSYEIRIFSCFFISICSVLFLEIQPSSHFGRVAGGFGR